MVGSRPSKIWLDVSLRNLVIMLAAAVGMGVEASLLLSLIPREAQREIEKGSYSTWSELLARHTKDQERFGRLKNLVGHLTHLEKALCTAMVSLADYNRIQDAFVAQLGHPWLLRKAGQYAITKSFGLEAAEKLLLRAFLRWFTDPFVAFSQMSVGSRIFNDNKAAECQRAGLGRALLFYRYRNGPEGLSARTALEDRRSLLYWIRGILEKFAPVWPSCRYVWVARLLSIVYPVQSSLGEVYYRVVGMNLSDLLSAEVPTLQHRLRGREFLVSEAGGREEVYGHVVLLKRESTGKFQGRYLGAYQYDEAPEGHGLRGIRLDRDVLSPSTSGEMLPIALKGEIYAPDAIETVIELKWATHPILSPLFRWLSEGPIAMQGLRLGIETEMKFTVAAAAAQTTTRQLDVFEQQVFEAFPTEEIGRAIAGGSFPQKGIANQCVVVVCDVIGYTAHQLEAERNGRKGVFVSAVSDALDACRAETMLSGGWVKPTAGDQIIAFFPLSWNGFGKSSAEEFGYGLDNLCKLAVDTAKNFRKNFQDKDFYVRIAVHVGELTWQVVAGNFDANGSAISVAAHIEGVALKQLLKERGTQESLLAVTADVVGQLTRAKLTIEGIQSPMTVQLKRGEMIAIHLVQ